MYSSLVLLISLAAVTSCNIETHQKKNVAASSNFKDQLTTPMNEQQHEFLNQPAFKIHPYDMIFGKKPTINAPQDNNIICPDGRSECASDKTCCLNQSGAYGCCNLLYATCCSDGKHCCPLGYSCNNDGTCKQTSVVCPNLKSTCPLSTTCCMLLSEDYGCCPLPNAVCCSDDKCCPSGYICNSDGKCRSAEHSLSGKQSAIENPRLPIDTIFVKYPTKKYTITTTLIKQPTVTATQNNICPDGRSECASDNTCCEDSSGGYGCCPLQNAACCSDGQHCCPLGYKCDVDADTCTKVNVVCPDQSSLCPLDNTCCLRASGEYGCCPNLNAVCCSDGEHCCPEGYTCDLSGGKCIPQEASSSTPKSIPCPDGGTCLNGNQPALNLIKLSGNANVKQGDLL